MFINDSVDDCSPSPLPKAIPVLVVLIQPPQRYLIKINLLFLSIPLILLRPGWFPSSNTWCYQFDFLFIIFIIFNTFLHLFEVDCDFRYVEAWDGWVLLEFLVINIVNYAPNVRVIFKRTFFCFELPHLTKVFHIFKVLVAELQVLAQGG